MLMLKDHEAKKRLKCASRCFSCDDHDGFWNRPVVTIQDKVQMDRRLRGLIH